MNSMTIQPSRNRSYAEDHLSSKCWHLTLKTGSLLHFRKRIVNNLAYQCDPGIPQSEDRNHIPVRLLFGYYLSLYPIRSEEYGDTKRS